MIFVPACSEDVLTVTTETLEDADIAVNAAFTELDYVDVYSQNGEHIATVDMATDFHEILPVGTYLMDFVSATGSHSLAEDGRLLFAPMMQGGLLITDTQLDGVDYPLWRVEVHPDLEANANLIRRQHAMDPSLEPWINHFKTWGEALNPDWDHDFDPNNDNLRSYNVNHKQTSDRLRVTWEAAYAMTGDFSGACNNAVSCWNARSGGYAYWDKDNGGSGYIDSDTTAWSNAVSAYGSNSSCMNGSYTCHLSVGTSTAKNYTCQNSSGVCTGGSGASATKPHGGQCKAFTNLVFWRSGEYNNWGAWKTFPTDTTISSYTSATTSTISVGDVLRNVTNPHAVIVVAYDTSLNKALVVDSNWVGGDGYEYIGWHEMTFTGVGNANLGNYKRMNCLYDASPC